MLKAVSKLLPENCWLSQDEIDAYWSGFAEEIEIAYSKSDFKKIDELFYYVHEHPIKGKPKGESFDNLLIVLYKIATRKPFFSISKQCEAFCLISQISREFIKGKPLLDWRLAYDFIIDLYINDTLFIVNDPYGRKMRDLLPSISNTTYFFSETAADEILDLLIPKISPRGKDFLNNIIILSILYPAPAKNYQRAVDFLIEMLSMSSATNIKYLIWDLLIRIANENANDDHSNMIDPLLTQIVSSLFYDTKISYLTNAAQSLGILRICTENDFTVVLALALATLFFLPNS